MAQNETNIRIKDELEAEADIKLSFTMRRCEITSLKDDIKRIIKNYSI